MSRVAGMHAAAGWAGPHARAAHSGDSSPIAGTPLMEKICAGCVHVCVCVHWGRGGEGGRACGWLRGHVYLSLKCMVVRLRAHANALCALHQNLMKSSEGPCVLLAWGGDAHTCTTTPRTRKRAVCAAGVATGTTARHTRPHPAPRPTRRAPHVPHTVGHPRAPHGGTPTRLAEQVLVQSALVQVVRQALQVIGPTDPWCVQRGEGEAVIGGGGRGSCWLNDPSWRGPLGPPGHGPTDPWRVGKQGTDFSPLERGRCWGLGVETLAKSLAPHAAAPPA